MASRIKGADQLKRKLRDLPKSARDELAKAMERSAREIVALAKSLAPKDSGALRDSIGWVWGRNIPKGAMSLGTVGADDGKGLVITIYAGNDEAFYARWVEFGSAPHINGGIFAGTQHPGTAAQPFFYPAYRTFRGRAQRRNSRALGKAIKIVAQGGGGQ